MSDCSLTFSRKNEIPAAPGLSPPQQSSQSAFESRRRITHRSMTTPADVIVGPHQQRARRGGDGSWRGGEVYFVTDGERTTFRSFLGRYLATQGMTPPEKSIPGSLARFLASLIESVWKLLRLKSEPPLTRFAAAIMSRHCTIRIDKIKRDMGINP